MSKPEANENPKPLAHPRNGVRMFREDDEVAVKLIGEIRRCGFKMDTLDLIREAVHYGMPAVKERWDPILEAAKKG